MKKGIDILTKLTPEEKVEDLKHKLALERIGRRNDGDFCDKEYKELSEAYLELCDDGYCDGDSSVGDSSCKFYNSERKECKLKVFLGLQ